MNKKVWIDPEVFSLDINCTELTSTGPYCDDTHVAAHTPADPSCGKTS